MPDDNPPPPQRIMQAPIPLPTKMDTEGCLASNWKKFKRMWTNYEIASRLNRESKELRTATLLTCIGTEALEVFEGFEFTDKDEEKDIDIVLAKFGDYYVGTTNEIYERYKFNSRNQEEGESIDSFVTALRKLAKTCNYGALTDNLIRDKIVIGIRDTNLRKKLLEKKDLTLATSIDICRASESTAKQVRDISQADTENISVVRPKKFFSDKPKAKQQNYDRNATLPLIACKFCGKTHLRKKEECPAWGKPCGKCQRMNHFAVKCPFSQPNTSHAVNAVYDETKVYYSERDLEDYTLALDDAVDSHVPANDKFPRKLYAHLIIDNDIIKFQLDCGATVNIIPSDLYKAVTADKELKLLKQNTSRLLMFNKTELPALGTATLLITNPKNGKEYTLDFVIVQKGLKPLIGAQSIQELQLMSVNNENVMSLEVPSRNKLTLTDLLTQYADVFSGEGKLHEELHLEVNPDIPPVKLPVRKIPVAIQQPLKEEIDRLESMGILAKVEVPTDWISAMVVARKRNGKIRLCIDPKPLNRALKRNHYPLPVIEDLLPRLANAKTFTVVDAKNGFWHVPLDATSSLLTTFATPWGRYRWTRMPFGISPAPEEFQRRLENALDALDGVQPIYDDILIYGSGDTEEQAIADHDRKLHSLLQRCREKGIKLNKEKLKYRQREVTFMGHVITADGLLPDTTKIEAIVNMPTPSNKQDVRRLLGMVNYLQKFSPNLSEATATLRDLLQENVMFQWNPQVHGESLSKLKHLLTTAPILKYFNAKEEVELQCDASDRGLGACLLQNGQPVAYASRSLSPTEQQYAQIEKEMLAIVFGTHKFDQYIYGRKTKVETDHKPLESILKKSVLSAPKRLQRMMLKLQKYDLLVTYKKGSHMYMADALSRAFLSTTPSSTDSDEDVLQLHDERSDAAKDAEHVNALQFLQVSEATLAEIKQAMDKDKDMHSLMSIIRRGWPDSKDAIPDSLAPYFSFRDELSIHDGLIFKGERLVIPLEARALVKDRLHAGHIGIQGSRELVYWLAKYESGGNRLLIPV